MLAPAAAAAPCVALDNSLAYITRWATPGLPSSCSAVVFVDAVSFCSASILGEADLMKYNQDYYAPFRM